MIDKQPNHPLIDGAWLSQAATYNAEGGKAQDQAIETYRQVVAKFADRYSAPLALLSVAEILQAQGAKMEEAKLGYESVKNQFPDSYFGNEAGRRSCNCSKSNWSTGLPV